MSLARSDGSTVDVVDLLLDLVPAHKRHHFTRVIGEQGRPAVMVSAAAPYDDTQLRADLVSIEARVSEAVGKLNQAITMVKQHEADITRLMDICRQLDERISSVSIREAA